MNFGYFIFFVQWQLWLCSIHYPLWISEIFGTTPSDTGDLPHLCWKIVRKCQWIEIDSMLYYSFENHYSKCECCPTMSKKSISSWNNSSAGSHWSWKIWIFLKVWYLVSCVYIWEDVSSQCTVYVIFLTCYLTDFFPDLNVPLMKSQSWSILFTLMFSI